MIGSAKNARCGGGSLKWLWKRLRQIATMEISREELLMKLGAASLQGAGPHGRLCRMVGIDSEHPSFTFALNRKKLRTARRREGRYLLRTNLTENDPAQLWHTTRSSSPSKRRSAISKRPGDPSGLPIRTKSGSKPTSSSPFWLIACRSRSPAAFMLWRLG